MFANIGTEGKSIRDITGESVASISYKKDSISIKNSEILKSDDYKIGNYVLLHSKRNLLGSAKGFEVTFNFSLTHIIYLLRMAFLINNEERGNHVQVSLDVGNHRKCELIKNRNIIPSKWSKLTPGVAYYIAFFICKAIDQNNFNVESKVIFATIDSGIKISVNWISFHLIGHYRIETKETPIPNCGVPDHPIGFEIKPNEQDQRGFTLTCSEGSSQDS